MKAIKFAASVLAFGCIAMQVHAQSLTEAPTVFTAGKWKVVRSVDNMTDKIDCIGIYGNDYSIQLTDHTLYAAIKGGIKGIEMRFDDDPVKPLRLPTSMEEKVGTVIINGSDFSSALKSMRLRIQVSTLVKGIQFKDIDTKDMMAALDNIKQGCPASSQRAATPEPISDKTPELAQSKGRCDSEMIGRMRSAKVTPPQIKSICQQ